MTRHNILFICGSINQTTMMHKISQYFFADNCYFTPYYSDGLIKLLAEKGLLDKTVLGGQFKLKTIEYLTTNNLTIDPDGKNFNYDLVFTCSDLIIPKNIIGKKIVLVQEGMTDPENILFHLVKKFKFPTWAAGTSATGISDAYTKFCVASHGYKALFIRKGVKPEKIVVTGIPNFDNCEKYLDNDFPYKNFVLAATSDFRETLKYENRKKFIQGCLLIANKRQLIFKLHPNENHERAEREINKIAPNALVFKDGNTNHMIANCETLITKYSSVVFIGLALNKEVYSMLNIDQLKRLLPLQNGGRSARNIAIVGKSLLENNFNQTTDLYKDKFLEKELMINNQGSLLGLPV